MTSKEIRELSPAEITTKASARSASSSSSSKLRKQTGQVEKTHELRTLRKDIARLETIANQKKSAPKPPKI